MGNADRIELASAIAGAWLSNSNNSIDVGHVAPLLASVAASLENFGKPSTESAPEYTPAVSARKSLASPDFIISMINGKPYKTLKRHLESNGLTPDQYRSRYGLPSGYPMTAPACSAVRSSAAKARGLGTRPVKAPESPVEPVEAVETPAIR